MKEHTIIFVPHARAKFRKWRFTSLQAGLVLGSLAFLTLSGITAGILYLRSSFDRDQLTAIQEENQELRQVNEEFEKTIREIEGHLADFDGKVEQLAIVAGISELTSTSDAGIGGPISIEAGRILASEPAEGSEDNSHLSLLESWTDQLGQNLGALQDEFAKREVWISKTPAVTPVKGLLTSAFGYRKDPFTKKRTFHGGIDIVAPRGREVTAPGDGIVIKSGRSQGLGNAVYLSHGYGLTTRYGHLMKITVEEGQKVKRGDVIGLVGNTGRSTGYHLHYEVRLHGRTTNPLGYIHDQLK